MTVNRGCGYPWLSARTTADAAACAWLREHGLVDCPRCGAWHRKPACGG